MWLRRFLGISWVDRCIMSQAPIDVASTFFWVDHRRFSGYFRRLEFQIGGMGLLIGGLGLLIGGLGGGCGGRYWLQLV